MYIRVTPLRANILWRASELIRRHPPSRSCACVCGWVGGWVCLYILGGQVRAVQGHRARVRGAGCRVPPHHVRQGPPPPPTSESPFTSESALPGPVSPNGGGGGGGSERTEQIIVCAAGRSGRGRRGRRGRHGSRESGSRPPRRAAPHTHKHTRKHTHTYRGRHARTHARTHARN